MEKVARVVEMHYLTNQSLPTGNVRDLMIRFCRKNGQPVTENIGLDKWGTVFRIIAHKKGFSVTSAGPDRTWRNEDDLKLLHELDSG